MSTIPENHEKYKIPGTSLVFAPSHHTIIRNFCHFSNALQWKGSLTYNEYVMREHIIGDAEMTRNGKNTYWVLYDTSLPLIKNPTFPIQDLDQNITYQPNDINNDNDKQFDYYNGNGNNWLISTDEAISQLSQIVGSCESLIRPGYRTLIDNKNKKKVELIKIPTHGIGGVYILPKYRGKGYGIIMMNTLSKVLENHNMSKIQLKNHLNIDVNEDNNDLKKYSIQILYSEVGEFYKKFGYISSESKLIELKLSVNKNDQSLTNILSNNNDNENNNDNDNDNDHYTIKLNYLSKNSFEKHSNLDNEYLKNLLISKTKKDLKSRISIISNYKLFDYFHTRSKYVYSLINSNDQINYYGSEIITTYKNQNLKNDDTSFIIWYHDFTSNNLYILRLFTTINNIDISKKQIIQLLKLALLESKNYNLDKVILWEGDLPYSINNDIDNKLLWSNIIDDELNNENLIINDKKFKINVERNVENGSLSAVRSWGYSNDNNTDNENEKLIWEYNGKYCWI